MGVPQRPTSASAKCYPEVDLGSPGACSPVWHQQRPTTIVIRSPRVGPARPPPPTAAARPKRAKPLWRRLISRGGLRLQLRLAWALVVLLCVSLLLAQVADRVHTLRHPPISTESRRVYNGSMHYPAVTICHMEGFKQSVAGRYQQRWNRNAGTFQTRWKLFPWTNVSLERFWTEATYSPRETITACQLGDRRTDGYCPVTAGLSGGKHAFSVSWRLQALSGACTTLRPRADLQPPPGRDCGIRLYLSSRPDEYSEPSLGVGWTLTVHDPRYEWSDLSSGWYDSLSVLSGEKVQAKLEASFLSSVDQSTDPCATADGYNMADCYQGCVAHQLETRYGCRPPWVNGSRPLCDNAAQFEPLLHSVAARDSSQFGQCRERCIRPCDNNFFSLYVMSISTMDELQRNNISQVEIYYPTGLTAQAVQRHAYGGVQFMADVGGLLGLLLGISVLSAVQVLQDGCLWVARRYWRLEEHCEHEEGELAGVELADAP
ncbi:acid-sensing ion channel 5-like [Pollicipes pollicipes]|uniref:acid-sensing ion channel 5-like n=1 Tax=Pollicipes pollicipes TaxID=41117 RepID=UPI001884FE86|nr:acid-sensing ion channel 5-like [Pollicipes pollicipes]